MKVLGTGRLAALAAAVSLSLGAPVQADSGTFSLDPDLVSAAITPVKTVQKPVIQALPLETQPTPDLELEFKPLGSGIASYYGRHLAGARTASGARFNPDGYTAAHRTLPFGTQVQVSNPESGESVIVTINDRGPFHGNRIIDLSDAAAKEIGILRKGSGRVQLAVLLN